MEQDKYPNLPNPGDETSTGQSLPTSPNHDIEPADQKPAPGDIDYISPVNPTA